MLKSPNQQYSNNIKHNTNITDKTTLLTLFISDLKAIINPHITLLTSHYSYQHINTLLEHSVVIQLKNKLQISLRNQK